MEYALYWLGTGAGLITIHHLIKYIFAKKEERNLDRTLKEFDEVTNQNKRLEPKRLEESDFELETYNRMGAQVQEIIELLKIKPPKEHLGPSMLEGLIYDTK